jgi:DnaJ-class molecular chaperone
MSEPLPLDPYKALSVLVNAITSEIRSAHRKLVLKCHLDRVQDAALKVVKQVEFEEVQRAYELLSDDRRRKEYDLGVRSAELRREMMEQRGSPTRPAPASVPVPRLGYFSRAPPAREAELYENSYETRTGPRDYSGQDEKARDRKARERAERASELRDKEKAIEQTRVMKELERDKARKDRWEYRSAYVEDDDSDDQPRRLSA